MQATSIIPQLSSELHGLRFRIRYRRQWLLLDIDHEQIKLACERGCKETVRVRVLGEIREICHGEQVMVRLP